MNIQNLSGQVLGQYELRDILGFGGMGVVYRGRQTNLDREVAIKVLVPGLANEPGYVERFYREAKTAAGLEHSHIVPVYDYGVQGEISYVVMRLLTGGTLEQRITQRAGTDKALPSLGEISELLKQLASALDYAHSRGVIHRDIKPGNVMFDDQGQAYIMDFGIAKLLESTTSYTATGASIGTPSYMPPEQWRSEPLTPAADQYALAITIYQLMTGRLPFEATTPYGMLHKHLNEEPTPPQLHRPDVPEKVREVLERALEKNPADRWETVTAFAQAFDQAIRGQTGPLTGFFTTPVVATAPRGFGGTGGGSVPGASVLVTLPNPKPVYKLPVVWALGAALVVVVGLLLVLLLGGNNKNSGSGLSPSEILDTARAQLAAAQTATVGATGTVNAQVAFALTATAMHWTATPSPDHSATVARLTQTQAAALAQATAEANGTATQAALSVQATRDAGATTTQQAAALTPTSPPTTDTLTPTSSPSATATSTSTAMPTVAPTHVPDLRAIYDQNQFILINVSTRTLDISQLVFDQQGETGTPREFLASRWQVASTDLAHVQPGGCYQIVTAPATQFRPSTADCPVFLGYFRANTSSHYFWIANSGATSFVVRLSDSNTPIATCTIAAGECRFALPQ
jgi:serine/threonine protein kinase